MNSENALQKYLSQSKKLLSVDSDTIAKLLDDFTDDQLKNFWIDYKCNRAYTRTESSGIPDWHTTNREKYFKTQMITDAYWPTKNESGKFVYEMTGLKKHIQAVLTNDTMGKINEKIRYNGLSFLEKLPFRISMSLVIMIPVTGLAWFINNILFIISCAICGTHYLLYLIVKEIIRRKRNTQGTGSYL